MNDMVGTGKILFHRERLNSFFCGETIFPVTLELGLTTRCNRNCPDCPSGLGRPDLELGLAEVEPLLAFLSGRTRGLIVTGGEPTMARDFAAVLDKARSEYGFEDIAVVTNGSFLDEARVAEALLAHASAVRVSLYDWHEKSLDGVRPTLERIRRLRDRVDRLGSSLLIGASALTTEERGSQLKPLAELAAQAGVHFLYFHPVCFREAASGPTQRRRQQAVLEDLQNCRREFSGRLAVHFLADRFRHDDIRFSAYHSAHFIMVLAADGRRYLATEVKYRPAYELGVLGRDSPEDLVFGRAVARAISGVSSTGYPGIGGRNRGLLYNSLLEDLLENRTRLEETPGRAYALPHVL